jgi:hypothetical protein
MRYGELRPAGKRRPGFLLAERMTAVRTIKGPASHAPRGEQNVAGHCISLLINNGTDRESLGAMRRENDARSLTSNVIASVVRGAHLTMTAKQSHAARAAEIASAWFARLAMTI